jgi:putative effector of murein hydrolase LrgA (UPF0299 family)
VARVGAVVLPHGDPGQAWAAGMLVHLLAGGIWGLAYAYFFFSLLKLRPAVQGMVFSLVPLALALFVLRPQLELMLLAPGAQHAPWAIAWQDAVSLAIGHLAWGGVLGVLYRRPVGHAVDRPPRLAGGRRGHLPPPVLPPVRADERFMFATGIECSYPTVQGGRWRMDQMQACGHYRHWRTDLALVREMGLRHLRYGPPLHLMLRGPRVVDWSFMDDVAEEMRRLEIVPIIDLCHFGVPDWLGDFQNPEVPQALAVTADALLRNLGLLFIPAGVGVIAHLGLFAEALLPIALAVSVGTLAAIAFTGRLMQALLRRQDGGER